MAASSQPNRTRQKAIDAYAKALEDAAKRMGDDLDKLLAEFIKIADAAGRSYVRTAELANHAYKQIEGPARRMYEVQEKAAAHVYKSIMAPADAELKRMTDSAMDMYNSAITPIESAYQTAINDAASIMQGTQFGDTVSTDTTTPWTT